MDEESFQRLKSAGIDDVLSRHVAHLFSRCPLVVFDDRIDMDDEQETEHFENFQSTPPCTALHVCVRPPARVCSRVTRWACTNWNSVRFKPPPAHSDIGWRVEFRTMEVQITDFENAALTIFVVLLSRAVLLFNLNFYMKISTVDENMARASARGAAVHQKFLFRCVFAV